MMSLFFFASMHAPLQRIWEYMKTIARGRKNLSKKSGLEGEGRCLVSVSDQIVSV